ncbi:MAG: acyltransferase, partial [Bdellovibrionales bacterium]|nr:acyltransferase [Bdellovibrionales bacterium]
NTQLGSYCIINAGHGVFIGAQCWFAAFVYVNSSDHAFAAGQPICSQGFVGAPIVIGDDNWIGGHVFISKGVTTGRGVVLGAGTILTKDAPADAIMVGNPGRLLRYRT